MKNRFLLIFSLALVTLGVCKVSAQWQPTSGPRTGVVRALAVINNSLMLEMDGSVFVSTDHGESWSTRNVGLPTPIYPNIFVQIGNAVFFGSDLGLYRSDVYAQSWRKSGTGLDSFMIQTMVVDGGRLYAGTNKGIYCSTDTGKSWLSLNDSITGNHAIIKIVLIGDTILTTGSRVAQSLFRSTDKGRSWVKADSGLSKGSTLETMMVCGSKIVMGCDNLGVYVSTNAGVSWNNSANGLSRDSVSTVYTIVEKAGLLYAQVYGGDKKSGVYISSDTGVTWTQTEHIVAGELTVFGSELFMFASYGALGIYRSTDNGITWQEKSHGLANYRTDVATVCGNNLWVATHRPDVPWDIITVSPDSGTTWQLPLIDTESGANGTPMIVYSADGLLLVGFQDQGVFSSSDCGRTWAYNSSGLPDGTTIQSFLKSGDAILASVDAPWANSGALHEVKGVFYSTDQGGLWNSSTWPAGESTLHTINCFAVLGEMIFAGSDSGLYASSDHGISWKRTPALNNTQNFTALLGVGEVLYSVVDSTALGRSNDSGATWQSLTNGLIESKIFDVKTAGSIVFIGSDKGVFLSTNNGDNWSRISDNMRDTSVRALAFLNGFVFAGGESVMWKRPLSELITGVDQDIRFTPSLISLEQNVPNPFSQSTSIDFTLPASDHAVLKIFNSLGQEIQTLVDGQQSPGHHTATFNADHLQNGVYWYRLSAGKNVMTQKMIVVR